MSSPSSDGFLLLYHKPNGILYHLSLNWGDHKWIVQRSCTGIRLDGSCNKRLNNNLTHKGILQGHITGRYISPGELNFILSLLPECLPPLDPKVRLKRGSIPTTLVPLGAVKCRGYTSYRITEEKPHPYQVPLGSSSLYQEGGDSTVKLLQEGIGVMKD